MVFFIPDRDTLFQTARKCDLWHMRTRRVRAEDGCLGECSGGHGEEEGAVIEKTHVDTEPALVELGADDFAAAIEGLGTDDLADAMDAAREEAESVTLAAELEGWIKVLEAPPPETTAGRAVLGKRKRCGEPDEQAGQLGLPPLLPVCWCDGAAPDSCDVCLHLAHLIA